MPRHGHTVAGTSLPYRLSSELGVFDTLLSTVFSVLFSILFPSLSLSSPHSQYPPPPQLIVVHPSFYFLHPTSLLIFTSSIPLLWLTLSLPSLLSYLFSLSLITHFTNSTILPTLFLRLAFQVLDLESPTIASINLPSFEAVLAQQVPVLLKTNHRR